MHGLTSARGSRTKRKRVGRGMGSGTGKTCGRGHKGQMARKGHKHKLGFEGGQMRLVRRLPKRGFKHPDTVSCAVVNAGQLERFDAGSEVTPERLAAAGLIRGMDVPVKVLGEGELTRKLTVRAQAFSESARRKIEDAGGKCEVTAVRGVGDRASG